MTGHKGNSEVVRCAEQLAARLGADAPTFADAIRGAEHEYLNLLRAVRATHDRFAFDREGRPGAVTSVREALPVIERDLFEAILEDYTCELAAVEEALYQFAKACSRTRQ